MYEDIYSVNQVARRLNVSVPTVYQWIKKGELRTTKVKTRMGWISGISDIELIEFMRTHRKYSVYSSEEEREVRGISKGSKGRLYEVLEKLYAARESLSRLDQDI